MAEKILMPKLSDTMEEGVITSWQVKVGDTVSTGDVLAEIETDKATMEHEAYEEGTILHLVEEGSTVEVDGLIAIIGKEGEDISSLLSSGGEAKKETPKDDKAEETNSKSASSESSETVTATKKEAKVTNAVIVQMPKLSDTMEEGVIAEWHKKVGDKVSMGDVLVEIETDKATMEHEAYDEGILLHIAAEKGDSIPVNDLLCVIGEKGADYEALIRQFKSSESEAEEEESTPSKESKEESTPSKEETKTTSSTSNEESSSTSNGRVKISPLARKLAEDKGFDVEQLSGTGEGGRIIKRDVESFQPSKSQPAKEQTTAKESTSAPSSGVQGIGQESFEEKKTSQMRKTIARRLSESKFTAPHFYLTIEIDMEEAMETRKKLNEISPVKISFNDLIVKAVAVALRQHPTVNSSWQGDTVRYNHHVNIGVAVAVDEGLLVPVIRFADAKSLSQISSETKELAQKAKDKKLQPSEWEGSTFSVSNLGMFGIEEFTAIINPPDACIMAIGAIVPKPIVKNGEIVPGNLMKVTLSCDHRVVDGASGAQFLATFKSLMESPIRMLV
jgi:pyruvate dehydrogenase E2 component (dihydrolipoamide acetyltransferase)